MCLNRTNICAHNQVVCLSLEIHSHWIFGFSNNMIEVIMRMSSTNLHQRKIFWNFIRKLVQMGLKNLDYISNPSNAAFWFLSTSPPSCHPLPPLRLHDPPSQNHPLNRFCETVIVASIVLTTILTLIVATGGCEKKHIELR